MASTDFALIIGVDHYPDFSSLDGPVNDALSLRNWIVDPNGGNVPEAHIKFIQSIPDPPTPIQKVIDDALKQIGEKVSNNHSNVARRLYFYFSGHGLAGDQDDNSLCMADWSYVMRNSAISSREYLNYLVESGYFNEIIFFLDCCRSRIPGHRSHFPSLGNPKPHPNAGKAKTLVFYATEFQNAAYEANYGAEIPLVRGHFTHALLRVLNGEKTDANGKITGKVVADFLDIEVPRLAKDRNQSQEAKIQSTFNLEELIFTQKSQAAKPSCTITFSGRTGMIRLEDGNAELVKEADAASGPWVLSLNPGYHVLTERSTGDEKFFKVIPNQNEQSFTF